jgi:hypothetical protein
MNIKPRDRTITDLQQADLCKQSTNRSITTNEIEAVIKSPNKENPQQDVVTAKFYQTFKKKLTSTFLKLFHKRERKVMLSNSFYEASITLIQQKKKIKHQFLDEHRYKIFQKKYLQTEFSNTLK